MPPQVSVQGKNLVLNGMGTREATVFKIDVYDAGLYLEKKSSDANQILSSSGPKAVRMKFLHDVTQSQFRDAWKESFEKNCGTQCDSLRPTFESFQAQMTDAQKGDVMVSLFTDQGMSVLKNGKEVVQVKNPAFSKMMLSTWIGKNPPTPELRAGLLGEGQKTG